MPQIVVEGRIKNGSLKLEGLPLEDETQVQVVVIPKIRLDAMSFLEVQELSRNLEGSLSDDVVRERNSG